eukprot:scaffold1021_cov108-Isochrysis_galbana.AAC.5
MEALHASGDCLDYMLLTFCSGFGRLGLRLARLPARPDPDALAESSAQQHVARALHGGERVALASKSELGRHEL